MNSNIQYRNDDRRSISTRFSFARRAAALSLLGLCAMAAGASPVAAQSQGYHNGHSSAMGVPGAYTSYANYAPITTPISAGATAGGLFNNGHGTVRGWSIGNATSGLNGISVSAHASAETITAKAFNSNPSHQSYIKYTDTLKITSSTLPYGTIVQVRIDPNASVSVAGQGGFSGRAEVMLSAGGKQSINRYTNYYGTVTERRDGAIVVNGRVGQYIAIDMSALTHGAAFYLLQGFGYNGMVTSDASSSLKISVLTPGAGYVSVSGKSY